jgi:hypothetical protein
MTRDEFRQYVHPLERSRFILELVFAIPLISLIVVFIVASLAALFRPYEDNAY